MLLTKVSAWSLRAARRPLSADPRDGDRQGHAPAFVADRGDRSGHDAFPFGCGPAYPPRRAVSTSSRSSGRFKTSPRFGTFAWSDDPAALQQVHGRPTFAKPPGACAGSMDVEPNWLVMIELGRGDKQLKVVADLAVDFLGLLRRGGDVRPVLDLLLLHLQYSTTSSISLLGDERVLQPQRLGEQPIGRNSASPWPTSFSQRFGWSRMTRGVGEAGSRTRACSARCADQA